MINSNSKLTVACGTVCKVTLYLAFMTKENPLRGALLRGVAGVVINIIAKVVPKALNLSY